jgi:hypothetical protein
MKYVTLDEFISYAALLAAFGGMLCHISEIERAIIWSVGAIQWLF